MAIGIMVKNGETYQIVFLGEFNAAEGQGVEAPASVSGFGFAGYSGTRELVDGEFVAVLGPFEPEDRDATRSRRRGKEAKGA